MAQARVGRITMKDGGATVRLLERPAGNEVSHDLRRHAAIMATDNEAELTGFVIVATYSNGTFDLGHASSKDCKIPLTLWPSYIAECARRRMLIETDVTDALEDRGL